jgi:hypothetical protein
MKFLRALLELLRAPIAIASITPVALGPEDVIVLRVLEKHLSAQQSGRLKEQVTHLWPGRKVFILDGSMSMSVMRQPRATGPDRHVEPPAFGETQDSLEGPAPRRRPDYARTTR